MAAHYFLIEQYGGKHGVRDPNLLESAVFRPQTGYYLDIIEEAAALMESLANNHPFVDGNKRTAFATTYSFLFMNGFDLEVSSKTAFEFITGSMSTGSFRFHAIATWLREHIKKL